MYTFALVSTATLATTPGALTKSGAINKRWLSKADRVWSGGARGLHTGRAYTGSEGGICIVASQRDYYGNGADNAMRADFFAAMGA
jgi:hypothetical protein